MNSVTQDMRYRQSLMKYAEKNGVSRASRKYNKCMARSAEEFWPQLETSLRELRTDCIDLYQFHTPPVCPRPGDESGLYDAALEAKRQGKIRFIGLTNHRLAVAEEAVRSGLYDTLQFPLCYLATDKDLALLRLCEEHNVGFIAMKALSGGLLTRADAAYAWLDQFDSVLPIWGIQRESELDEFLSFFAQPPVLDDRLRGIIEQDRAELLGSFCRSCGYCLPCPVDIKINNCARMSQLIRRAPSADWLGEDWQAAMENIENCLDCGQCQSRCPYELEIPRLLKANLADYRDILAGRVTV